MSIIKVKKLWENGELVAACNQESSINCQVLNIGSLKEAWIKRTAGCCGGGDNTEITFQNPNDPSAIKGIWVEANGQGMILDAATVAAVTDKCNACCGEDVTVAPVYNGTLPPIASQNPNTYCITRSDNGTYLAIQNAFLDYQGKYQTMVHKSNASGVSKYEITAPTAPVPVGTDVIAVGACDGGNQSQA